MDSISVHMFVADVSCIVGDDERERERLSTSIVHAAHRPAASSASTSSSSSLLLGLHILEDSVLYPLAVGCVPQGIQEGLDAFDQACVLHRVRHAHRRLYHVVAERVLN